MSRTGSCARRLVLFAAVAKAPPDGVVRRIYGETERAMSARDVKDRLAGAGNEYVMSPPEAFVRFLRAGIAKWTRVVSQAGLRAD